MLSVIVPIYNTGKYLEKCLCSIAVQNYNDFEVLMIDDGSTDFSSEICKSFCKKDKRFQYIYIQNGGQGKARNYGLDIAKGDRISFIDSDDWIEQGMFETMIRTAEGQNADLIICGWFRDHGFKRIKQVTVKSEKIYNTEEVMKEYLTTPYITSSSCNKIYDRKLWDNLRFPEIKSREDVAILYKVLSKSKKAVFVEQSFYNQYVRPGSTERSKFNRSKLISLDISREIRNFIESEFPSLSYAVSLKPARYCVSLMGEIIKSGSLKSYKQIYDELYTQLVDELDKGYSEDIRNSKEFSSLCSIRDNQFAFKIHMMLVGKKDYVIDSLKILNEKIMIIN